jgi:hydrogenase nickel incorporation protein HypA/HybF
MHELSIVMSIIDIAHQHAEKEQATSIDEIDLDIGNLSTVEPDAFEFAWKQGVKNTLLSNAIKNINWIKGMALCSDCNNSFEIKNLYDECTHCKGHLLQIISGKELRVRSLIVS